MVLTLMTQYFYLKVTIYKYYMIIDIVVILKFILYFYSIDNGGVHIRYPCPNTDTPCYNTEPL